MYGRGTAECVRVEFFRPIVNLFAVLFVSVFFVCIYVIGANERCIYFIAKFMLSLIELFNCPGN